MKKKRSFFLRVSKEYVNQDATYRSIHRRRNRNKHLDCAFFYARSFNHHVLHHQVARDLLHSNSPLQKRSATEKRYSIYMSCSTFFFVDAEFLSNALFDAPGISRKKSGVTSDARDIKLWNNNLFLSLSLCVSTTEITSCISVRVKHR